MARFRESFDKANAATLGPDLTWTEVLGTPWGVTSNQAHVQGGAGGGDGHARAEHDVVSPDLYVEATLRALTLPSGAGFRASVGGISARYASAADTCLTLQAELTNTAAQYGLRRWVAGVESAQLAANTQDPVVGDRVRIECRGTSIRCYVNGILVITHTEGTILTGTRGGFRGVLVGTAGTGAHGWDDWEIGDLGRGPLIGGRRNRRLVV